MNNIDLQPEYLTLVIQILQRYLPTHTKIWLFGSRANGRAKKYSDIDLLIDQGTPISLETMAKLNLAFEESLLPYKVDLADAKTISDDFRKNIQSQLVTLS